MSRLYTNTLMAKIRARFGATVGDDCVTARSAIEWPWRCRSMTPARRDRRRAAERRASVGALIRGRRCFVGVAAVDAREGARALAKSSTRKTRQE
jgi:hypothetical protein